MAAFDYAPLKSKAETLLAKFGQTVTLRRKGTRTGPSYQPIDGAPTDTSIIAVDLRKQVKDANGVLTGETRRELLVSTSAGIEPRKDDLVQIGGQWHEIISVRPVDPAGTALLYKVELET